jgi:hypothetical protein
MIDRGAPLKIVWNGAENYGGYWYSPKGTPRAKLAFRFLEFVSPAGDPRAFLTMARQLIEQPSP